jgi:parallel beta-helix repeat protein
VVERSNIVVYGAGHVVEGNGTGSGITLAGTSNVTVKSVTIREFLYGINLTSSSGNTLYANKLANNTFTGIWLDNSTGNSISANIMTGNHYGIYSHIASGNSIAANTITNNSAGINLFHESNNNSVTANTITNCANGDGIYLGFSSGNSVSANTITNSAYGNGIELSSASGSSVSANTITNSKWNGIYLVFSPSNRLSANTITNSAIDGILLHDSPDNSISKNTITSSGENGIFIDGSSDNSVSANTITDGFVGVRVEFSAKRNSIAANTIANNYDGIRLYPSASNNSITENSITSNSNSGIYIDSSPSNSIAANTIASNTYGVYMYFSVSNLIWHNSFVDNTAQAIAGIGYNVWDNGYPSGGNYWSDYTGVDLYKGPAQNVPGTDEIGDTPYTINANNVDHYPLMNPWTPKLTVENAVTWRRVGNTTVTCVASGDADGDGAPEIVTGGYYYDGSRNVALLHVWNAATWSVKRWVSWFWGGNTVVTSIAIGDVDGDGNTEIVTGGHYYDGLRNVAQVHVWDGATLVVKKVQTWYWGGNTTVNCLAVDDVDGDGQKEIVTGGHYFDGTRTVALLHIWNGATLEVKKVQSWMWGGDTTMTCLAIGDLYGDGQKEIVTGGYYYDGVRRIAQLHIWNGITLAVGGVQTWYWGGSTEVSSVCIGDVEGDGASEIVTGGYYYDGVRNVALLHIWSASLSVEHAVPWFWGGDTKALSVAVGDVDGDGKTEVVTGGYYYDGSEKTAQLHVWDGASLRVKDAKTWYSAGNTVVSSMVVGDVNGDSLSEIVTGGTFYSDSYDNAQLMEWTMT